MSEEEKQPQVPPEPVVYASPLKRLWAWVGVVYMVIIVLLMTYMFANGAYLHGIAPLMVIPAIGGLAASAVCLWVTGGKQNRSGPRFALLLLIVALCAAICIYNLSVGIPALKANFGG